MARSSSRYPSLPCAGPPARRHLSCGSRDRAPEQRPERLQVPQAAPRLGCCAQDPSQAGVNRHGGSHWRRSGGLRLRLLGPQACRGPGPQARRRSRRCRLVAVWGGRTLADSDSSPRLRLESESVRDHHRDCGTAAARLLSPVHCTRSLAACGRPVLDSEASI